MTMLPIKSAKCSEIRLRATGFPTAAPQKTLDHPSYTKSFKMRSEVIVLILSNKKSKGNGIRFIMKKITPK